MFDRGTIHHTTATNPIRLQVKTHGASEPDRKQKRGMRATIATASSGRRDTSLTSSAESGKDSQELHRQTVYRREGGRHIALARIQTDAAQPAGRGTTQRGRQRRVGGLIGDTLSHRSLHSGPDSLAVQRLTVYGGASALPL